MAEIQRTQADAAASDYALQIVNSVWGQSTYPWAKPFQNLLPDGSIDESTRIVLVNAIHLKFPWASPFDPMATAPASFTLGDGTTVSPDFMNQTSTFSYVDDGQAQVVGLPLFGGGLAFVIALPHDGVSLSAYEASLTASSAAVTIPAESAYVAEDPRRPRCS